MSNASELKISYWIVGIITTIIFFIIFCQPSHAAPNQEADWIDAPPVVAYGKDSNGVLRPLLTDTDGSLQAA